MEKSKFLVRVSCMTYNHAPYIVDAMNGFCMQETDFPFVCTIMDDASTDGEQEVIKKYLADHFDLNDQTIVRNEETDDYVLTFARHKKNHNCYFAVFFLKYNHYSIRKSKSNYIEEWEKQVKYIAMCEGDDYWVLAEKLQKQFDILENDLDSTMVCNRTKLHSVRRDRIIGEQYCLNRNNYLDPKDVIRRGGLYISTCSIFYRSSIMEDYPDYCRNCLVGDLPLQLYCAMKGRIYYFNDIMSAYRIENNHSWMGTQKWGTIDKDRLNIIESQIHLLKCFCDNNPLYKKIFKRKISQFIIANMPAKGVMGYCDFFNDYIKNFTLKRKCDFFVYRHSPSIIKKIYKHLFLRKYSHYIKKYKKNSFNS